MAPRAPKRIFSYIKVYKTPNNDVPKVRQLLRCADLREDIERRAIMSELSISAKVIKRDYSLRYLYLYKYENVCLCVCLCIRVFLGYLETDWDTLWHKATL